MALAAALVLVHAFLRLAPVAGVLAAASYAALLGAGATLSYETAVLTESLYTSMLVLSAGALLLGAVTDRWPWYALFSLAIGAAILLRPAGLYLAVVCVAVAGHALWRRAPRRSAVAAVAGVAALVGALSAYNLMTAGVLAPTSCAAANLAAATSTFWAPDPAIPPALDRHTQRFSARITPEDRRLLATSWAPAKLVPLYARYYNPAFHDDDAGLRPFLLEDGGAADREAFEASYLRHRAEIARLARDAIRARPRDYAKFVWTGLHTALFAAWTTDEPFYETLDRRRRESWPTAPAAVLGSAPNGFADQPPAPAGTASPARTPLVRAHERLRGWLAAASSLDRRAAWVAALFLASAWTLVARRGRHPVAFAACCLSLYWLGAVLTTPLVQLMIPRYLFPTLFVVQVAPVLLLALLADVGARDEPSPTA